MPSMDFLRAGLLSLLLLSFFAATLASLKLGGNETDRISLLELKANIIDPLGALNAWNESAHFCKWAGVQCGHRHRRVTALFLNSSQLGGRLSPHIGNLSFLRRLHLHDNIFSHQIPEEIGRLHRLQYLSLSNNSFDGTIPTNLSSCFSLWHLALDNNKLTGEIPSETGSLPNLEQLYLGRNNLRGEIPSSIANLSSTLEVFHVESNHLSGRIPGSFALLKRIEILAVGVNNLSGTIPPSIYNLSSIIEFYVEINELRGELPSHVGYLLLPNLEEFVCHTNRFSGTVPDISNASNLISFQVGDNPLSGKVPKFSNLPNLKHFVIDTNNLGSGKSDDLDFLASLVNCTDLEVLCMNRNNFGGKLPASSSNFSTKLWYMHIGSNQIKGSIPTEIGNLVSLSALDFGHNQMTGPIPSSIGKLQDLSWLNFNYNKLSGTIPSSLGNLTSLTRLYLEENNLQGALPSSLGECKSLARLTLFSNNLSGPIPKEVVSLSSLSIELDLALNYFTGSIPIEVGQLVNLNSLDLSFNYLSGEIPESLGKCVVLMYLFLAGNSLQGTIPKSLFNLKGLVGLDLSQNNLSGKFPTFLETFSFQWVNFSFNNLEGEMPIRGIFSNASVISVVGNPKLCGGIAELDLPKCPSKLSNKHKHSYKLIASLVCGLVGIIILTLLSALLLWTRKRKGMAISGSLLNVSHLEVSYGDLLKATDGFSTANLIGTGSFGSVYKGDIIAQNKTLPIAVKVLNLQASSATKSFVSECKVLGSIKHRNVVKLITACSSIDFQGNDFKALVYEFMINGSLEEWLHPRSAQSSDQRRHLNFSQRLNIAIDIANALDHLHNNSHVSVVHSDIKPSNILLDTDMIARVGDFGLARFLKDPSLLFSYNQSSSIGIRGSIGYIAPEYSMGSELTKTGDVYSYGILILEMFTGKRPTDEIFKDNFNLHNFVKNSLHKKISLVMDSALLVREDQVEVSPISNREESPLHRNASASETCYKEENYMEMNFWYCLNAVLNVGVSCSEETPTKRMSIANIVKELQHIKSAYTRNDIGGLKTLRKTPCDIRR